MKEKLLLFINIILSPLKLIGKTYDILGEISIPINTYLREKYNWDIHGNDRGIVGIFIALVSIVLGFLVHTYFLYIFLVLFMSVVLGGFNSVFVLVLIIVAIWLLAIFGVSFLSTFWELLIQPFS